MKKLLLFTLLFPWFACQPNASQEDPEAKALKARQEVFGDFATGFQDMSIDSLAAFSAASIQQQDSLDAYPMADSLVKAAISEALLQEAGFIREGTFDTNSMYYARGHFPFNDKLDAYLIEAYQSDNMRSTHLFLFDKEKKDFTLTHPLNFLMAGGVASWSRQAWLYDSNQDQVRDVVYLLEVKAENEDGQEEYIITDSLRVETWTGNGFAVSDNYDGYSLRTELGLPGSETKSEGDSFDFF